MSAYSKTKPKYRPPVQCKKSRLGRPAVWLAPPNQIQPIAWRILCRLNCVTAAPATRGSRIFNFRVPLSNPPNEWAAISRPPVLPELGILIIWDPLTQLYTLHLTAIDGIGEGAEWAAGPRTIDLSRHPAVGWNSLWTEVQNQNDLQIAYLMIEETY